MRQNKKIHREAYFLALPPVLLLGAALAAIFFGLIIAGPLKHPLLVRYCLSHPVAIASVSLFFIGLVTLVFKWYQATAQLAVTKKCTATLNRLTTDGQDISPVKRPEWTAAHWNSLPKELVASWFSTRLSRILEMQISRGRRNHLDTDLKNMAEADADRQHDSYSLLRIINWAMPMLGFLGTVLGISQTLGQLDTKMLATQQQEAMNQLTAGLYVAFDTTAIALVLTVFLMFLQFGVSRLELRLLAQMDESMETGLISFLAVDPFDTHDSLLQPIREMTQELIQSVQELVEKQAVLWGKSIAESQTQWSAWTQSAAENAESQIHNRLSEALALHVEALQSLQDDGFQKTETRWKQWQTTLSDQSRQVQSQQQQTNLQTELLSKLVESTTDLRKLEEVIQESVVRLDNVGRIEEAAVCVGEAVALMATSLERAGVIRGAPTKPRPSASKNTEAETKDASRKAA